MEYNGLVLKYRWLGYSHCFVELVIIKPVRNKLKFIIWEKKPIKCKWFISRDKQGGVKRKLLFERKKNDDDGTLQRWGVCFDLLANFHRQLHRMPLVISSLIPLRYFGIQNTFSILNAHCDRLKLHHLRTIFQESSVANSTNLFPSPNIS